MVFPAPSLSLSPPSPHDLGAIRSPSGLGHRSGPREGWRAVSGQSCCGLMGVLGKAGGAGLRWVKGWVLPDRERGVRSSHPTDCASAADGVPALAGMVRRRRGGGLPYGVYRTRRAAWNTTAGVRVQVFAGVAMVLVGSSQSVVGAS